MQNKIYFYFNNLFLFIILHFIIHIGVLFVGLIYILYIKNVNFSIFPLNSDLLDLLFEFNFNTEILPTMIERTKYRNQTIYFLIHFLDFKSFCPITVIVFFFISIFFEDNLFLKKVRDKFRPITIFVFIITLLIFVFECICISYLILKFF